MTERKVVIDAEQARILQDIGEQMLRDHDERATKVLALTLAYRYAAPPELPSNVYPIVKHVGDDWSRKVIS